MMGDNVRLMTFNSALSDRRTEEGQLIEILSESDYQLAQNDAAIIQYLRPEVLVLQEFDYDANSEGITLFQENYLEVAQQKDGFQLEPIEYEYVYVPPTNTGELAPVDLNNDGEISLPNDAYGFGNFPGQYGMVILSQYEIDVENIRTFQAFLWKDVPSGYLQTNEAAEGTTPLTEYYSEEAIDVLRLSSKNHVDVPININGETIHVLASHPTPPVFDGEEKRNLKRNNDEIRFWADYIAGGDRDDYIYDDNDNFGGLEEGTKFVIMGDQNADPLDGDSDQGDPTQGRGGINQLLIEPSVYTDNTPFGAGGVEAAYLVKDSDPSKFNQQGNPGEDTSNFGLRVDYVLPSENLEVTGLGVFSPDSEDPRNRQVFVPEGTFETENARDGFDYKTSDHRAVFVDVDLDDSDDGEQVFKVNLFHQSDQEGFAAAPEDANRNGAIMNRLRSFNDDPSLFINSGDLWIAGLYLEASDAVFGLKGSGQVMINNYLNWQTVTWGNHEFDIPTDEVANALTANSDLLIGLNNVFMPVSEDTETTAVGRTDNSFTIAIEEDGTTRTLRIHGSIDDLSSPLFEVTDFSSINLVNGADSDTVVAPLEVNGTEDQLSAYFTGVITLTEDLQTALENGDLFVNVHTENNQEGEVKSVLNLDRTYPGTDFPYISSNMDFENDPFLGPLQVEGMEKAQGLGNKTTPDPLYIDAGGEMFAVVGATTPTMPTLVSNSVANGGVVTPENWMENEQGYDDLAALIQAQVDRAIAGKDGEIGTEDDVNKVIVSTHMQKINIDIEELVPRLSNVDVYIAGGSNTIFQNPQNPLYPGDEYQIEHYPLLLQGADGLPTAVVNTDANHKYLGYLQLEFDENGVISNDFNGDGEYNYGTDNDFDIDVSRAYPADISQVEALNAENLYDPRIDNLATALSGQMNDKESRWYGITDEFLNGQRLGGDLDGVRNQETNLSNLIHDSYLWYSRFWEEDVVISMSNGSGIRASVGQILPDGTRTPNDANDAVGKPEGGISQADIESALAFNNGITLIDITGEQLKTALESIDGLGNGDGDNGAYQIGGFAYSFDPDQPEGSRVRNARFLNEDGSLGDFIIQDGEVVTGDQVFRMATLGFNASRIFGFIENQNRVNLDPDDPENSTGGTVADKPDDLPNNAEVFRDGSQQDSLAEYLYQFSRMGTEDTADDMPIGEADTSREEDERVQILSFRDDSLATEIPDMFRINPYLQQPSSDGTYITWFTEENISSEVSITGPGLNSPLTFTINPTFEPVLSYTDAELNQEIEGLESGSWLLGNENYKHTVDVRNLLPNSTYEYSVTVGDDTFESSFETAPTAEDWDEIRFVVFSDSETEPRGRVNRRDWQQGALEEESLSRPDTEDSLWAETFGVRGDRLNYPLTENVGYRNNLEIINSREPDFLMMPGDLVQGGGYQPAWDEFFRHNAGEFDSGLSEYPILPALGNWENFGALNGGYGTDEDGRYGPLFGRQKYHIYFDAPENGTPEHQDNYYRTDYGPITILTLDSSNGEPDDNRNNYGGEGQPPKISGQEYTGPGTDTQENITREQYEAAGGTDLADFNPGSPQWNWAIEQLESAREQGQIVFIQFHHAPYSNGTHGLPMNHEDSSGQGGTPMRQYQPLFEEYGVVAVFSGHSEMFERSFVDEDNDGEGVYYYDVGVAGDGMRGQRTDADGNLLSYNQFSQWTADQNEPELWQEVDGVLQNVAGGKHYGHLEVNLENLGEEEGTRVTFTPVYSFPILDANYNLIDTERRVYGDEIVIELDNTSNDQGFFQDFNEFSGNGFAPNPSDGQLNSNVWIVKGLSDGDLEFGEIGTTGDFARGVSAGGVTPGGVYGFEPTTGDRLLGVQPSGSDFTPGEFILRLQNQSETTVTEVDVEYTIRYLNDQARANSLNFSFSEDNSTFTPITDLDFTTPETADSNASWQSQEQTTTITNLNIAPDEFFYLKWMGDDVSGSGSRDEYGIDDVFVSNLVAPGDNGGTDPQEAPIYEIQGEGDRSPLEGEIVTTTGVITADFRSLNPDDFAPLRGVFIQDVQGDSNDLTSDGLFVFLPSGNDFADISLMIGDLVTVTGTVTEDSAGNSTSDGRTEFTHLDFVTDLEVIGTDSILPTDVLLPETSNGELEQYEGMLVNIASEMTVSQNFFLGRYGQMTLSSPDDQGVADRLFQPTNLFRPGVLEEQDKVDGLADENQRRLLILDDGQDSRKLGDNPDIVPFLGAPPPDVIRAGDKVENLVGVLDFGRINSSSSNPNLDYRLQVLDVEDPTFISQNPRQDAPDDVGGRLKVASFNIQNYFTTLRRDDSNARGAFDEEEFERQRTKIFAALEEIDADIIGLVEIENNGFGADSAIQNLVDGLNDRLGAEVYTFVNSPSPSQNDGRLGTDAITNPFIYKSATVNPVGDFAVLDKTVDPRFDSDNQRPALAVTFEEISSGETVIVANNHFKSKGSPPRNLPPTEEPNPQDQDLGDGQGFSNFTRTQAAQALVDWLATDPTNSGDSDILITGDLNAYALEDPIVAIQQGTDQTVGTDDDYTNLIAEFVGEEAYSFVFDGQAGYLDHVLASKSLNEQVTGVTEWHINADEPKVIDYEDFFNPPGYYSPDPFRASDHDPIVVGLDLGESPTLDLPKTVFGTADADVFDTETPDDKQFLGDEQNLFAGSEDDYVDVTFAPGGNRIDLGSGDDYLFGGTDNRIIAGSGDDALFVGSAGGNNLITGGSGRDRFWLVTDAVDLPAEANIITDFMSGEDVIGFGATNLSFEDLALIQEGNNTVINALNQDLAILRNTQASTLSESDFVFA